MFFLYPEEFYIFEFSGKGNFIDKFSEKGKKFPFAEIFG
jgi:hypothetical protein